MLARLATHLRPSTLLKPVLRGAIRYNAGTVGGIQSVKRMSSTISILTGGGANSGGGQVHVMV